MRKKILLTLLIVFIVLPVLLYTALRSSYVQNYLVQKVASYMSNELETEVKVGGVNVTFFMNIVLEEVSVKDRYDEHFISVDRLVFNTGRISFRKRFFKINELLFKDANFRFVKYQGDDVYNFQFLIDYFTPETKKERRPWDIKCKSFVFRNSNFLLRDFNSEDNKGQFDPANILLSNLNLDISDVYLEKDTLTVAFNHMSFVESGGFELNDFSGDVRLSEAGSAITNMVLKTSHSKLYMDAVVDYDNPGDFKNFADNVRFDFDMRPSSFGFFDIGLFVEEFAGKEENVKIKGSLSGRLSNFRGRDFTLLFGNATLLDGNFFVSGLPNYDNTFLNLSVNEFRTRRSDIDRFVQVADIKTLDKQLYNYLVNLGNVRFNGNLTGFLYDFVAFGNLYTDIGIVKADIAIYDDDAGEIGYRGSLVTQSFDMGKFLNQQPTLGKVSFDVFVEGKGTTFETAIMQLEGAIDTITIRDYSYRNIELAGNLVNKRFNGNCMVTDPNINIDFAGIVDLHDSPYQFDFYTRIDNANLTKLDLFQRDSLFNSILSTNLTFNLKGNEFDDMIGEIHVDNTNYTEVSIEKEDLKNVYLLDKILITNYLDEDLRKNLAFESDIIDVNINGDIRFEGIASSVNSFFASFMPSWYAVQPDTLHQAHRMDFKYLVDIKDVSAITELFVPGLDIAEGAEFEGYYSNNSNDFVIQGNIPQIVFNTNIFHDFEISGNRDDGRYVLEAGCSRLMLSDTVWLDNLKFKNSIANDTLNSLLEWKNIDSKIKNEGLIESIAKFYDPNRFDLKILPSKVFIRDSLWQVNPDHIIRVDSAYFNIDNFMIYKKNEHIIIDGIVSKDPEDVLLLGLKDFDIANFDWFFEKSNLSFEGLFSGDITLSNIYGTPNVIADAEIVDFGFNNDHLGNLLLTTKYDHEERGFEVLMEVVYFGNIGYNKPIVASGFYYPEREDDNFDLDIRAENLKMSIFGRYLEGFAQNFRGMASGNLRLEGPANSPELSGRVRLARTGFKVDYLNTSYTFAHYLEIGKDYFAFEDMVINDTLGNRARATGRVYHNNFRDFVLDIEILPENTVLLNTGPATREAYYGAAFATGRAHIHGPVDNIVMDIAARTNRGTRFFLPLTHRGELKESSFITFVSNNDTLEIENATEHITKISGLALNFDLEVTPDAEVQLIFDPQMGDIIRGRGYGDIRLEITSQGSFNMYGDYRLEEGEYLFTLQNMLNKRFRIEKGGSIRWAGDPLDAEIDLKAYYRTRAALYDLIDPSMEIGTSEMYRRRIPVDVVLEMKGELFNPDLVFDINLPQADEATREMVNGLVATEQEMNRQIFSLLVLSRFTPTKLDDTAIGHGVGMTSTEMLSNQISDWLSQISSEFDIGVNYRPGDEISSQEMEVALSTQLFDDRLIIDGQVGVAGEHPSSEQKASNIIGDVNIEYKITPEGRFRIKAFNRSNTIDVFNTNALYTQGIGLFYRKEFDNFNELFNRRRKETDETPEYEE